MKTSKSNDFFSRRSATTIILSVLLVVSVFAQILIMSSVVAVSFAATMHGKEDVFSGKFSGNERSRSPCSLHVSSMISPNSEGNLWGSEQTSPVSETLTTARTNMPAQAATGSVKELSGSVTIVGKWKYSDPWGNDFPVRRAKVQLMSYDPDGNWVVASGYTADDGTYCFTDIESGISPYVKVWAEDQYNWEVHGEGIIGVLPYFDRTSVAGYNVPDGFYHDFGTTLAGPSEAWYIGDAVLREASFLWQQVHWSIGERIKIFWPSGDWPCWVVDTTPIIGGGEWIELPDRHIFEWDDITVYHEYAHAVFYYLYGSWSFDYSGPEEHTLSTHTDPSSALSEGWAEFMEGVVAVANSQWPGDISIEKIAFYKDCGTDAMDGEIVEGAVANILWDIYDPINTAEKDDYHHGWEWADMMDYGFGPIFWIFHDHSLKEGPMGFPIPAILSIVDFCWWWVDHYDDFQLSIGPLCSVCWNYGIDWDYYPPYGSFYINSDRAHTKDVSVELNCLMHDFGSGIASMCFKNYNEEWSDWYDFSTSFSWTLPSGDGEKFVYAKFRDREGLVTYMWDSIVLVTTAPIGSITIGFGDPAYTKESSVTLCLEYFSFSGGTMRVRYSDDGVWDTEPWEQPSDTKTLELTPGDGLKTVYFQILDVYMWMFSETFSDTIILDTVAPTTIILHDPGSATFSLSATDNVSPTIRTCYILDQQQNSLRIYTGPFTLTGAGSHRIDYYSIDEAGNEAWGTPLRVHYLHVNTEPEGIAAISGRGWYDENTIATTGTAPDTIPFYNIAFAFSTWKKDGTPVTGNPANIFMDAPHTATAFYTVPLLPVANFTQSPLNPKVGELTTFDASNSTPNGGTIEWYFWDFNDTTTINGTAIETHAFASPETYNVTLTIRDSEGLTDMTWQLVTVISAVKHDISILNVTTSTPHQYPGRPVNITLAVKNNGEVSETFNVTVYRNSTTAIGTILVTDLGIGENTTVIFNWDTTGLIPCHNWTISAEAPIVGDINPGDNNFTDGTVKIVMIGDVNADGVVDGQDVVIIIEAIPSYPGHPWWNPQADLDNDGVVDGADVVITLINLGKTT